MSDSGLLHKYNITVNLEGYKGELTPYRINWLRQIEGDFYETGMTGLKWPFDLGTGYIVKITDDNVTPLSCTMYFTVEEYKLIDLFKSLHMDENIARERVYKKRIEEYEQVCCSDSVVNKC